jgi:hypothetical protein
VAKTIFSGEMGMQFVTLFLIVIAIILFGIMGTLEGKELAALLGGLSGYILGRATHQKSARDEDTRDEDTVKTEKPEKARQPSKPVTVHATHATH